MEIRFNIEKSQRKALAQKIAELTGAEAQYLGVPSCAYQIDVFGFSEFLVLYAVVSPISNHGFLFGITIMIF